MKLVLDTSAILSGMDFEGEVYVPSSVIKESGAKGLDPRTESFLEAKARVLEPRSEDLKEVREASMETGDEVRLSPTDVDVLALAVQLGATVVTDDYSMQNVATRLGLEFRAAVLPGIRENVGWSFRCTGCGRYWRTEREDCPVCGSRVRRYRSR